ncbi:putative membrane protein YadS [Desulfosalsimonas propionicica]|uniref:Putative membrane protein YadS n=1 Tax=Desulfosalsimonas propionicica TaxID=332175 RepID=A0A7W0HLW0_9BACT|nr:putative sulfate exporter family transporter [Desulfosalsimonas propionicica]MBA2882725.1 putative membrane protein YadS [Desulfosalsimonas propionicica]
MVENIEQRSPDDEVVMDKPTSQWSDLWKKEDYMAIWLGFVILLVGVLIYFNNAPSDMDQTISRANATLEEQADRAPFKTIEWFQAMDAKSKLKATSSSIGNTIKEFTSKPHGWSGNPVHAFYMDEQTAAEIRRKATVKYEAASQRAEAALAEARQAQQAAAAANFNNESLNEQAFDEITQWREAKASASAAKKKAGVSAYNQIPHLIGLMIVLGVFFGIGMKFMGKSFGQFVKGFLFVFLIAILAYTAAGNATMKHYGIGYAAWAILFGLIISNTVGTPKWVMPSVQTEYFIKTGLVLLGAEILFGKILSIGVPGIFVAWVVTPTVLITTYIVGQKLIKIPSKTLNMTVSADMSVCGVSAAIATAAACRAKKEELTLAVGLSLVFTSIMMIVMPAFIKAVGMPEILGGAWMGGTIDATGAVAAAGAFLGERALYTAATVKMIQNVLIGVIAFGVAVYWCAKVDCAPGQRVSAIEIWHRFPKFVIGFITASIVFSFMYSSIGTDVSYAIIDHGALRGMSKIFRGWFFCLAFVSIGLATNFRELRDYFKGGKPLILYVCGQTLNLCLTLLMAYIMFYKVFPEITARI